MAELNHITADAVRENLHYDPDTGVFTWKRQMTGFAKQGSIAGSFRDGGYRHVMVCGKRFLEHRLVFLYMNGALPQYDVDHINGIKHDNRWVNLRDVPTSINTQNIKKAFSTKTTSLLGAFKYRNNRWQAKITTDGKEHHIGYFSTEEEAHDAYIKEKRIRHTGCTI